MYNPLESSSVVGMTNYVDLAVAMRYGAPSREGEDPVLSLLAGAAWQINRCWLMKAATAMESTCLCVAFKTWHAALNAAAAVTLLVPHSARPVPAIGLSVTLGNEGDVVFERSAPGRAKTVATLVSGSALDDSLSHGGDIGGRPCLYV